MKLITVILTTLLIVATSRAQTCTTIYACDVIINDNCYAYVGDSVSWNQAEACCVAWGGHLASIHSAGVNSVLNDIRNIDRFAWIGLSDTATDGVYVWTDGTPFDYSNFALNQPDSYEGESCFHIRDISHEGVMTWNDLHCNIDLFGDVSTSYICQKSELKCKARTCTVCKCYSWNPFETVSNCNINIDCRVRVDSS